MRRLRHHPGLALWWGNNESQAMHRINNDKSGADGDRLEHWISNDTPTTVEDDGVVTLSADDWLAFVHLTSPRADLRFSDNHFDLAAGEGRTVRVTATSPIGPGDLTVRCWNNR